MYCLSQKKQLSGYDSCSPPAGFALYSHASCMLAPGRLRCLPRTSCALSASRGSSGSKPDASTIYCLSQKKQLAGYDSCSPPAGFEPATHGLTVHCSTNWAKGARFFKRKNNNSESVKKSQYAGYFSGTRSFAWRQVYTGKKKIAQIVVSSYRRIVRKTLVPQLWRINKSGTKRKSRLNQGTAFLFIEKILFYGVTAGTSDSLHLSNLKLVYLLDVAFILISNKYQSGFILVMSDILPSDIFVYVFVLPSESFVLVIILLIFFFTINLFTVDSSANKI